MFAQSKVAGARVRTIRVPGIEHVVRAQVDVRGRVHLLFQTPSGPKYAVSVDNGLSFSEPIPVINTPQKPGLEFHAEDLAAGKDGRVFVALGNNAWKLKLPQNEWGFFYSTLEPSAKAFTPVRNLNLKPSEGFSLASDQLGNVTASFLSGKLYTKTSSDNGETFSENAEPNAIWNPCDCCTTSSTYGPDGKLALLYREETNNERDMFLVLRDGRNATEPKRVRISTAPWKVPGCPMTYFSINGTPSGYVAAWPTKEDVYFARLDKDGQVLPPGEIKTPGVHGMRTGVLALGAKDGTTLVAWKKDNKLGWQLYTPAGKPLGEPDSVPSPGNGAAGVTLPNGEFLLFP